MLSLDSFGGRASLLGVLAFEERVSHRDFVVLADRKSESDGTHVDDKGDQDERADRKSKPSQYGWATLETAPRQEVRITREKEKLYLSRKLASKPLRKAVHLLCKARSSLDAWAKRSAKLSVRSAHLIHTKGGRGDGARLM